MGRIYYLFGKSSCGKDSIYQELLKDRELGLKGLVLYTTRPMRDGEIDGVTYHFTDEEGFQRLSKEGRVIESRTYETVHGVWRYFTAKDEALDLDGSDYLATGSLGAFLATRAYFGKEKVVPIYIEVDDGIRLSRALERELRPENRRFKEMCRRFLADDEDYTEEKLAEAGIEKRFVNDVFFDCLEEIAEYIRRKRAADGYPG